MSEAEAREMRWPEHPNLIAGESLSSWVRRLASVYGLRSKELLIWGLGISGVENAHLDKQPPEELIAALSMRTGEEQESVKRATLAGMMPFLFDELGPDDKRLTALEYLSRRQLSYGLPWFRKWTQCQVTGCRLCLEGYPNVAILLPWRVAILQSCPEHGLMLESAKVNGCSLCWLNESPEQAPKVLRYLDSNTWSAMVKGDAEWFWLLRMLHKRLRKPMSQFGRPKEWHQIVGEHCPDLLFKRSTQGEPARRWAVVLATAIDLMAKSEMELRASGGFYLSRAMREHDGIKEKRQMQAQKEAARWTAKY